MKKAFWKLNTKKQKYFQLSASLPQYKATDVAVIGIACRFPGAENYQQFWQNLREGKNCVQEIPIERWNWQEYYGDPKAEKNKTNIIWGGFINDIDKFDALFFNISPKEAAYIDPQHRIFLEETWHAIEDAGYSIQSLSGKKVGVYVGVSKNDYSELMREKHEEIISFVSTGTVHSILANRVSFLLNLRGKSEAIDTACSSSLVALDNAIDDINNDECELAIVGGVNALLSPTMFISHSKSGMLAPDGKCKTFDINANGYVRGEGVGVLLLKPLEKAIQDHDHIHGIIRGSAINHGGRSNFLTAPNANAQAEVVEAAIRKAGIDPYSISYIEAHGTGTALGDPIEINGLKKAFGNTSKNAFCGLGTVKTNIGHLESAAGIAGIIKVLLSMQYQELPGILHFNKLNSNIELEHSPFYIVQENEAWNGLKLTNKFTVKRAGVSSFGMGGVNAHILLEEAPKLNLKVKNSEKPYLMVLSAKVGRLQDYARRFLAYLDSSQQLVNINDDNLACLAYTLQVGRDSHEERVCFIVNSLAELKQKIHVFLKQENSNSYFYNRVKPNTPAKNIDSKYLQQQQDLTHIANMWVEGAVIDWQYFYKDGLPRRLPIPGYPFARKTCWIETLRTANAGGSQQVIQNKENTMQIDYPLTCQDYHIQDHIVSGTAIMPGASYLELIRSQATANIYKENKILCFNNVFWLAPIQLEQQSTMLNVNFIPDKKSTKFIIKNNNIVHCQGNITHLKPVTPDTVNTDLTLLRSRCTQSISKIKLYQLFQQYGLNYGPSLQPIEEFRFNENEAIAKLVIEKEHHLLNQGYLHPAIIDGALQTVVGLSINSLPKQLGQLVPYYVETLNVFSQLTSVCYAHAVMLTPASEAITGTCKFNIMIYDEHGQLLVNIYNFNKRLFNNSQASTTPVRRMETSMSEQSAPASKQSFTGYYQTIWEPRRVTGVKQDNAEWLLLFDNTMHIVKSIQEQYGNRFKIIQVRTGKTFACLAETESHIVLAINPQVLENYKNLFAFLAEKNIKIAYIIHAWNLQDEIVALKDDKEVNLFLRNGIYSLIYLTQALITAKKYPSIKLIYLYESDSFFSNPIASLIGGFARTLKYENPNFIYIALGLAKSAKKNIAETLVNELYVVNEHHLNEICYRDNVRLVRSVRKLDIISESIKYGALLRNKGTYLITGGAGGLGMIFSLHLARKYQANIVLLGRTPLNDKISALLNKISTEGGTAEYINTDVTNHRDLKKALKFIKRKFKAIHGIIHAAGVIDDAFILRKTVNSFTKVIQPKLKGAINLDELTKKLKLDFFLVFSSIAAIIPNQGQCDYAAANNFLDAFSQYRNNLRARNKRTGITLSINWPLWREGGMKVTPEEEAHLLKVFGMKALELEAGTRIFEQGLLLAQADTTLNHLIAIEGNEQKINQQFNINNNTGTGDLTETTENLKERFIALFAKQFNLAEAVFDSNQQLSTFNIDSLIAMQLSRAINQQFQLEIRPTVFFESNTVNDLFQALFKGDQNINSANAQNNSSLYSLIDIAHADSATGQFSKTFDCTEFYMVDHVVNAQYNVPGACYIEMARQAAALMQPPQRIIKLLNNYWVKQLSSAGSTIKADITLTHSADKMHYEITSIDNMNVKVIHAVGDIVYQTAAQVGSQLEYLDIGSIKQRCKIVQHPEEIYRQIIAEGLHVGPTFMPMQEINLNDTEALAILKLPESILNTLNDYFLHPSLLTGVFQTALISNRFYYQQDKLYYIPIAIDELEIFQPFTQVCYVYSQQMATNKATGSLRKFNIVVCNEKGEVLIKLKNFSIKGTKDQSLQMRQQDGLLEEKLTMIDKKPLSLEACENFLKQLIAEEINIDPIELDSQVSFENYGINSVMILQLNARLEEKFGMLSKTLFFEYSNINELADYFIENHIERLNALLQPAKTSVLPEITAIKESVSTKPVSIQVHTNEYNEPSYRNVGADDIAIIGVSGRYPQAKNLDEFWDLLQKGKDCIIEIPPERFDYRDYYDPDKKSGKIYSKWGSFLDDIDKFDPLFFNISPYEAERTDPQERLLLEIAWETLEDAGYTKESIASYSNKVGVFVGALWQPYINIAVEETLKGNVIGPCGFFYSIANRISYFMGFHGPSFTVDTACSSSLTALHLACESIKRGESHSALVGGVNLSLHSSKYIFLAQNQFLASDGRCRSFGDGGDGYVPGEGAGLILIKPLAKAIEDGDHIYGVIKSTTINHGGKANGYTVPNPNAHRELIIEALDKADINPESINYIEAHGTGTILGDPIEVTGLTQAFSTYTDKKQYCAIGSVKSNMGHLEAAAGICSLTKVILQMKYKKLAPSIHSKQLNPNIQFNQTPFYVQQELTEWKTINNEPRRAGLNSFGAGGSNAHAIIEEWPSSTVVNVQTKPHYLITLSAKQPQSLQQRREDLYAWLKQHPSEPIELIAYTLNTGRSHFNYRCAWVVSSTEELMQKLEQVQQGQKPQNYFQDNGVKNAEDKAIYEQLLANILEKLKANYSENKQEYHKQLEALASLYVKGYTINWQLLHQGEACRKISLPTYPFLKERYWLPVSEVKLDPASVLSNTNISLRSLHPLVGWNSSTLSEQLFKTLFTGQEFYLKDHVIQNQQMLPGVAYLEMAKAAGELADPGRHVIMLREISWLRPLTVDKPTEATIHLHLKEKNIVRYEITTGESENKITHGQGELIYGQTLKADEHFDFNKGFTEVSKMYTKAELYQQFRSKHFYYGSSFQSLEWVKTDGNKAVGCLKLAPEVIQASDRTDYVLHPSLLDGALQTTLVLQQKEAEVTSVPFAIDEVRCYSSLTNISYVLVEYMPGKNQSSKTQSYRIRVVDDTGSLLVDIIGFHIRELRRPTQAETINHNLNAREKLNWELYSPEYQSVPVDKTFSSSAIKGILAIGISEEYAQYLRTKLNVEVVSEIAIDENNLSRLMQSLPTTLSHVVYKTKDFIDSTFYQSFEALEAVKLLNLIKMLFKIGKHRNLHFLYIYGEEFDLESAMIKGLLKTARLEIPTYAYHAVCLPQLKNPNLDWKDILVDELLSNPAQAKIVRYQNNQRQQLIWQPLAALNPASLTFRKQGVYLITGGLGGLGMIFAHYLAKEYQAKLVLTGRSQLSEDKQTFINTLKTLGSEVLYKNADISHLEDVQALVTESKQRFGKIHGVLHAAGVIRDGLLMSKELSKLTEVLSPKVKGTLYLDQTLKDEPLDFIVLFSSVTSVLGNIGQSDYAMGNAFMDAFAYQRNLDVQAGKRFGKTISINWPLWQDGGMQVQPAVVESLKKSFGIVPLSTEAGIQALEKALRSTEKQIVVAEGDLNRFIQILNGNEQNKEVSSAIEHDHKNATQLNADLMQKVYEQLITLCAHVMKIKTSQIDVETPLDEYGLDSILMMSLLREVEAKFHCSLSPNAFIDYRTIAEFAAFLVEEGIIETENKEPIPADKIVHEPRVILSASPETSVYRFKTPSADKTSKRIAVIGMAGRFPQSPNLEIFWQNLVAGKNLITDVPSKRWPITEHYDSHKVISGKTYSKWGGFLENIEYFAADFFGVKPDDAILMDPTQRLLLEATQELLERAGYQSHQLSGSRTGVFIGAGESDYFRYAKDQAKLIWHKHSIVNRIQNMQAARIADFYNFTGPAYTIDTACSSSLVALHQACQSLLSGESELAIVGGAELLVGPEFHIGFSQAEVLSVDDKSYVFDERANGFVLGEGIGLVLLKPYEQALADGDIICGVILGSAINNDGHTIGLTVPNLEGQKQVIQKALENSGVSPTSISYYEAHGTGTLLGDPIEIKAMSQVYQQYTTEKNYCAVGSIKSNMGHTLHAAGIVSAIKTLLCLQHKTLVPTLNCEKPHPRFQFGESAFYPNTQTKFWEPRDGVRRAAISSFGFGGTNCHLILEEAPDNYVAKRHPLPITALNRQYFWLINSKTYSQIYYHNEPYLRDHTVFDQQVLLGVTHCSLAINAFKEAYPNETLTNLHKVYFSEIIQLAPFQQAELAIVINKQEDRLYFESRYKYKHEGKDKLAATGEYNNTGLTKNFPILDIGTLKQQARHLPGTEIYSKQSKIVHGPSLQTVQDIFVGQDYVLASLKLSSLLANENHHYLLHPAFLDGAIASNFVALSLESAFVPFMIKDINIYGTLQNYCYSYSKLVKKNNEIFAVDILLCDEEGNIKIAINEFTCKKIHIEHLTAANNSVKIDKAHVIPSIEIPQSAVNSELATINNSDDLPQLIQTYLKAKFAAILNTDIARLSLTLNFMDMGVDSNQLVQLSRQIEAEAKIELYPTLFFEYVNLEQLSQYFVKEHAVAISRLLQPSANEKFSIPVGPVSFQPQKIVSHQHAASNVQAFENKDDAIAVIGMGGIFPGSANVEEFWEHLKNKTDLIAEIPLDHWDYRPWFDSNRDTSDKLYCKWGSFISDVDKFDAAFFNIAPREAELMDPQLRLLLQVIYATTEDAGYINTIKGTNTGIYVGACFHDYQQECDRLNKSVAPHDGTGNAATMLANRPSFFFDLTGPSLAVDTACSSSLVALHLACQALKNRECDMAFVAGVNLLLSSWHYRYFCSIGALSPTGRCHTFDGRADGYVPGEAIAAVLLKPLSKALADGDCIQAIIKGSAINHGGYTPSITAPSVKREAEVLLKAWRDAKIDPATLGYIEAHGTGTSLGDPVEINALKKAFAEYTNAQSFCCVGSAKAHIGHTEGAAGLVGIIKAILAMRHQQIPAMPQFESLNPYIKLDGSPLVINTEVKEWITSAGVPRRAGISSFGFGGAYAHVVVEEAPKRVMNQQQTKPYYLIALSAKHPDALKQQLENLSNYFKSNSTLPLEAVAYTLNVKRQHFNYRVAVIVNSVHELESKLNNLKSHLAVSIEMLEHNAENIASEQRMLQATLAEIKNKQYSDPTRYYEQLTVLSQLYLKGHEIDWNLLHQNEAHEQIPLPTYPFLKERYWVQLEHTNTELKKPSTQKSFTMLHPLVQQNTSDSKEISFRSHLNAREFYLDDHRVQQQPVLPGVAYIEIAKSAASMVISPHFVQEIQSITWLTPIKAEQNGVMISIQLTPQASNTELNYEIYSENNNGERQLHGQGLIVVNAAKLEAPLAWHLPLNLEPALPRLISKNEWYSKLNQAGLNLGSSFQVLQWIKTDEVNTLAYYQLPEHLTASADLYELHPSILDGAIQSIASFSINQINFQLELPFALEKIGFYRELPQRGYLLNRRNVHSSERVHRFDLQIMDEVGNVCIEIFGLTSRPYGFASQLIQQQPLHNNSSPENILAVEQVNEQKAANVNDINLHKQLIKELKSIAGEVLQLSLSDAHLTQDFSNYGFDSIMFTDFANRLKQRYSVKLAPTIFFEYSTLNAFADYLLKTYPALLKEMYQPELLSQPPIIEKILPAVVKNAPVVKIKKHEFTPGNPPDIAIIGMAGIFPAAPDVNTFWQNLFEGKDCIAEIPANRWRWQDYDTEKLKLPKWAGFIDDIDKFDPSFFGISRYEAELMDPQQRICLQTVCAAIEEAGYPLSAFSEMKTGLFVGVSSNDYFELLLQAGALEAHTSTGIAHSILANRISYLLNLTGPSEAVDTACSSSLVALHHAVQAIQTGDCEAAIVGGVNALLTPTLFKTFTDAGMLSPDGRCKTFDKSANGYVRGEGAGAIVLKPLWKALADQDHIYAVVKATNINHGGHVNTLTAPNPNAQAELIIKACKRAGISCEDISYIEAHGTGTPLGDPIEINGLKKAFAQLAEEDGLALKPHTCAVGSVKANIGHLESAAGIAGVIKVLLMFKHKQLVPQPHFNTQNPYVDFENSPFYISKAVRAWETPGIRRAGISSFGFGGANAHVILEEPPLPAEHALALKPYYLLTLSAKEPSVLQQKIKDLSLWLTRYSTIPLGAISYNLNRGKDHFNYRLSLVVNSLEELQEKLTAIQKDVKVSGAFQGKVPKEVEDAAIYREVLESVTKQLQHPETLAASNYRNKLETLANLYVKGYELDWTLLHQHEVHQKISLPTYPFAKQRYWVELNAASTQINSLNVTLSLHPLIGYNDSTLEAQCYKTKFNAQLFYLRDHQIAGQLLLPGVCYLEMARAAGTLANPTSSVISLKNVVWLQPISVAQAVVDVAIQLWPKGPGQVRYEVVSAGEQNTLVHGQGELIYGLPETAPPIVAIENLQARMSKRITQEELYTYYHDKGFCYGPSFQSVQWVMSDGEKALGYLTLPVDVQQAGDRTQYVLHPSLLDGALHCILGLVDETAKATLAVPFSVEEVKCFAPLPDACYVLIERATKQGQGATQRYNIQVLNSEGRVLVELIKFNVREIPASGLHKQPAAKAKRETYGLYTPHTSAVPLTIINAAIEVTGILAIGLTKQEEDQLKAEFAVEVFSAPATQDQKILESFVADLASTLSHVIYKAQSVLEFTSHFKLNNLDGVNVLRWVQALAKSKRHKSLHWVYVSLADNSLQSAMVQALFKTLALELPHYTSRCLIFSDESSSDWVTELTKELQIKEKAGEKIQHQQHQRQRSSWRFLPFVNSVELQLPWRKEGVYLITGGLGGLGMIFARYLAKHYQAKLVLTGRSALTEEKQTLIETLGSEVLYINADISRIDEVEALVVKAQQRFGKIQGVLHSAGVIQDSLLLSKELNKLTQVLAPKVLGTLYLDQALKNEPLDFMVFFSSITSVLGNIGQSDYAMANAFMDAFAHEREKQVQSGQRQGKTLSINWPLWKDGGMQIKPQMVENLTQATGLVPLSTEIGIQALEQALCQDKRQALVAEGNLQQFDSILMHPTEISSAEKSEAKIKATNQKTVSAKELSHKEVKRQLLLLCANLLKVDPAEMDSDTPLSEYGLDSILMMNLLREVEHAFQCTVSPNALTDYQTIEEFSHYLVSETKINAATVLKAEKDNMPLKPTEKIQSMNFNRFITTPIKATSGRIAIIGMAGRFPKSATLEKFWENLVAGKNLITEAPSIRGAMEDYYQPGKGATGKTYTKWGGFLDDVEYFAADYFGVKPDDAILIDPPQRLLLEITQELLDRAGYSKQELSGTGTGVFIGGRESDYWNYFKDKVETIWHKHTVVNNIQNMQAARIADFYNLLGPAYTIDTACSSSLVAVHQACQSLLTGESTLAIAGGAEIVVGPNTHIGFSQADVLSPENKSYVFDERANGFVIGEGIGLVLLKSYEQALADGDQILGVILSSAINNDGHTVGLTIPSLTGQQQVIQKALDKSGISPATISYYEAHGTGTLLGDPIEIKAMTQIYQQHTSKQGYCAVGSVKSNMGHALHAAGIASLIKTILCMQHQTLVPTLHCEKPHPRFQFEESAFYPIVQTKTWAPAENEIRRAAISSFGFGGTNCHMILEEAPANYSARRTCLPLTVFKRQRYWLDNYTSDEDGNYYAKILQQLENGDMTEEEIIDLIAVM